MREIGKVALRLFLIMILAGLCLGATYTVTKDPIAEQERLQQEADRRAVLPAAASFEAVDMEPTGMVTACYRGLDESGNPCGYALSVTASGFGGDIAMTVGVSDGAVTGVRIGTHSETPGLGARAADDSFLAQFVGKSGSLTVNKNGAQNDSEISAITAATITSRAVTDGVNEALAVAGSLE
ncbi:MAG: RnfABCDGE type electron transport complex subunit G [Candidatus Spyradocola sp.]|jgi:electron transport complex protein RnfG